MNIEIARNPQAAKVINEEDFKNLYVEALPFTPETKLQIGGKGHELTMLALQGYVGDEGHVAPHREKNDTTEMYFPLTGSVEVALERDGFHSGDTMQRTILQGTYSQEELSRAHMRLVQGAEPLLVVEIDGQENIIHPTVLPPEHRHATTRAISPDGEEPLFLTLKAKRTYSPADIQKHINTTAFSSTENHEGQVVWGSGHMTKLEWDMVAKMKRQLGSWQAVRTSLQHGNRLLPDYVTDKELVDAGVAHGCPVITDLMLGDRTNEDMFAGYTAKNRGFRAFARMMREADRADLLAEWRGIEEKQSEDVTADNVQIGTPHGLEGKLPGVEKLAGFWVGQILRVLDETRLGLRAKLASSLEEQHQFTIPWKENFSDIIADPTTRNITDVATKTVGRVAYILHERGIDEVRILQVLKDGLPIEGLLEEQGQLEKMTSLTRAVENQLMKDHLPEIAEKFSAHAAEQIHSYVESSRQPLEITSDGAKLY